MTGETRRPPRKVACPCCGAPAEFSPANPWRPFCSERCRQVDLGAWASEAYRIPQREAGPEPGPDEAEGGGRGSNTPGQ